MDVVDQYAVAGRLLGGGGAARRSRATVARKNWATSSGKVPGSNGFGMNPMQPARTSWFAWAAVPDVNATTGMPRVAASDFNAPTTARPSIPGMW